ncbi:MAG TPA: hypothetical protein VF194_19250 [Ferrovibrio sp.]|uniref:hypothetical protein n=1 Tax=Ferrovibrio sp. TaxID=1917215 RepID=UPI002ED34379
MTFPPKTATIPDSQPLVPATVAAQIEALALTPGRPLLIADADEVLFYFMRGLERFLDSRDLYFDWRSYALYGNIRHRRDGSAMAAEDLHPLLQSFFAEATELLEPVEGAAAALAHLAGKTQIVVLSNVPLTSKDARARALVRHGMDFPLIANSGPKGPAVAALLERVQARAAFIDDIPHNHTSVAKLAPVMHRLHFIADPRLAALLGRAPDCHHRVDTWDEIRDHVAALLIED